MSCKIYKKMSNVNEMALDNRGRSVLHYLIQPLPSGSFDNYVLLQQLVAIGAPLDQQDKDGKTVLDHAVANGLPKLSLVIQYLMRVDKKQYVSFHLLLSDVVVWCCCCLLLLSGVVVVCCCCLVFLLSAVVVWCSCVCCCCLVFLLSVVVVGCSCCLLLSGVLVVCCCLVFLLSVVVVWCSCCLMLLSGVLVVCCCCLVFLLSFVVVWCYCWWMDWSWMDVWYTEVGNLRIWIPSQIILGRNSNWPQAGHVMYETWNSYRRNMK